MAGQDESWATAASIDSLPEGSVIGVEIAGHEIAVYHLHGGEVCATSNVCTHGQALLSDGWMTDDSCIECPLHGGLFDIRTGEAKGPFVNDDLRTYPVRVMEGQVLVRIA